MLRTVKLLALVAMFFVALSSSAQVTTSALSGVVTDENQQAMIGATITALHTPSSTKFNLDGGAIQDERYGLSSFLNDITEDIQPQIHTGDGKTSVIAEQNVLYIVISTSLALFFIAALFKDKNIKLKLTRSGLDLEITSKKEKEKV